MCKDKECEILNHMKEYHKEYRAKKKDKLNELRKQKYSENRESIISKIKEYNKLHKEEILIKHSAKTTCMCGGSYTYSNKTNHMKTKKHLDYISAYSTITESSISIEPTSATEANIPTLL